jgi:hypothetical protein
MTMPETTTNCGNDSADWHIHEFEIPQGDGYRLSFEDRVHENRPGVDRAAAWRVREPIEPHLPGALYTLLGNYPTIEAAFAALAPGVAVPVVECSARAELALEIAARLLTWSAYDKARMVGRDAIQAYIDHLVSANTIPAGEYADLVAATLQSAADRAAIVVTIKEGA